MKRLLRLDMGDGEGFLLKISVASLDLLAYDYNH